MVKPEVLEQFEKLGGVMVNGFPVIDSPVYHTSKGTPYLKKPGVALINNSQVNISSLEPFLKGFDPALGFTDYLSDPVVLSATEQIVKIAGQTCYSSWGPKRTQNKDAEKYFANIVSQGHGSVLEHTIFSLFLWGISRSFTHELVRHRAGTAISQLSQRYVSGAVLRFVERPEYQNDTDLHHRFEERVDTNAGEYELVAEALLGLQESGEGILSGEVKTDRRKKVQQAARSVLANEAESSMVFSVNVRAGRHISNMRASEHAEVEIRTGAYYMFLCMALMAPGLFADFKIVDFPDGTKGVKTDYPKV